MYSITNLLYTKLSELVLWHTKKVFELASMHVPILAQVVLTLLCLLLEMPFIEVATTTANNHSWLLLEM